MRNLVLAMLVVSIGLFTIPGVTAEDASHCEEGREQTLAAVPLILLAGPVRSQICFDHEVAISTSVSRVSVAWTGPGILAGTTVTTVTTLSSTGCTLAGWGNQQDPSAVATGGSGTTTVTMTSNQCGANIELLVTFGTPPIHTYRQKWALNIGVIQAHYFKVLCDATENTVNSFSASATNCNTPDIGISAWPGLETLSQSHRSGPFQFEGSATEILVPNNSGVTQVKTTYQVRALAGSVTGTTTLSLVGSPIYLAAGGNAACSAGTVVTQPPKTMVNGDILFQMTRQVSFDADYCTYFVDLDLVDGANSYARAYFNHVIRRESLDVHQDEACGATVQCLTEISGQLDVHQDEACGLTVECQMNINSNVTINGNISVNQTNLPPPPEESIFNSAYLIIIVLAIAFAHLGETRRDQVYRIIAGILFALSGAISVWEQSKLGFDELPRFMGPFWVFSLFLATYFIYPKNMEQKEENKNA